MDSETRCNGYKIKERPNIIFLEQKERNKIKFKQIKV